MEGGSLRVISRRALREFWHEHPEAESPLSAWYLLVKKAAWQNLAELKETFPSADLVGRCTVFNVGGNNYRVIVRLRYAKQILYIRNVLTHSQYDRGRWKDACYD
jgi:mRNA interferase HigB